MSSDQARQASGTPRPRPHGRFNGVCIPTVCRAPRNSPLLPENDGIVRKRDKDAAESFINFF